MASKAKQKGNALYHGLKIDNQLKNYNRWIYENIKEAIGNNILEIGSGMGSLIDFVIAKGRKITGAEIDDKFFKYSREKYAKNSDVKIVKSDSLELEKKFKKGSFDTVTILNTLEHIKDDFKAVKIIYNLLDKGGKLAVFVPAFQCIYGKLDENVGHYRRYTKATLRKVLEENNFEIKKIYYMNFIGFFGWYFNAKFLKRGYTPELQSSFFDNFFVPLEKAIEKIIKPPIGQSVVAIAVKRGGK